MDPKPSVVLPTLPPQAELATHPYAELLPRVQKPGRYLGGEEQSIIKRDVAALTCRFVLAFPDLYEIGMSHLGTRILYDLINKQDDLVCERAFSPWVDLEAGLRERGLPLVSLETFTPLRDFDVVGVSLQHELCFTNVLLNLDLGGIPLRAADRSDGDPFVIAGGPTATHPEPLTPFLDLLLVGEAEEVLCEVLRTIGRMRREGRARAEILAAVSRLPGIYVPSYYRVEVEPRTGLEVVVGRTPAGEAADAPMTIRRTYVRDLGEFKFPTTFPVPYAEAIFDRASVEITRGCTEGCRFCQAGMIYRPVRERTPEDIVKAVLDGVDAAGFDSTSLTALSTADVSCIDPLIKALVPELAKRKVSLGIASLRAYGLNDELIDEIKKVGIDGLTFAPEAGTQRMRDVINKNVSEEDILASARRIFERGYDRIKMYFIMGLPTETDEDVDGILETGRKVKQVARELGLKRMPKVTCSVSQHVPKPHTPFQWAAMASMEELDAKVWRLRDLSRRYDIALKTHEIRESWLECLFSRGDRRMADVLEWAYLHGARFDGWRECFRFDVWLDALAHFDVKPEVYTQTLPVGPRLPWSHIDVGLEDGFLEGEWRKAVKGRVSPPCGKPLGAKVHHTTVAAAEAESKRLVCYDCGVACDLSQMRQERLVALRTLSERTEARELDDALRETAEADAADASEPATPEPSAVVPADRLAAALKGRLAPSLQAKDSAYKSNAEAPYSRLRLTYAKRDNMAFMSHLDLVRVLPRTFRRAGIELAFTRGFSAKPRLSFGPALALGMTADAEVMEVDVILDRSAEDMAGFLDELEREVMERDVLARLRAFAPPGLDFVDVRLVRFGEMRVGELVGGAEYAVWIDAAQRATLEETLPAVLASESLVIERVQAKKGRGKRTGEVQPVDIRELLLDARIDGDWLRFRVRLDPERGSVRPRELVKALLGAGVPDHHFRRVALLTALDDGSYVPLSSRTFTWRPDHRRVGEGPSRFGPLGRGEAVASEARPDASDEQERASAFEAVVASEGTR